MTTDFETHDVGYVAYLKGRIFELEQLADEALHWKGMTRGRESEIDKHLAEIKELKEGACRFNCRTRKEAFIDGFRYGVVRAAKVAMSEHFPKSEIDAFGFEWDEDDQEMAEMAYKEYLEQENRANP